MVNCFGRFVLLLALAVLTAGFTPTLPFDPFKAEGFNGHWIAQGPKDQRDNIYVNFAELYLATVRKVGGKDMIRHANFFKPDTLDQKSADFITIHSPDRKEYAEMKLLGENRMQIEHFTFKGSPMGTVQFERCKPDEKAVADGEIESTFPKQWTQAKTGTPAFTLSFTERAIRFTDPKVVAAYGGESLPVLGLGYNVQDTGALYYIIFTGDEKDRLFFVEVKPGSENGKAQMEMDTGMEDVGYFLPMKE